MSIQSLRPSLSPPFLENAPSESVDPTYQPQNETHSEPSEEDQETSQDSTQAATLESEEDTQVISSQNLYQTAHQLNPVIERSSEETLEKKIAYQNFMRSIYFGTDSKSSLSSLERLQAICYLICTYVGAPIYIVRDIHNLGLESAHREILARYLIKVGFPITPYIDKFEFIREDVRFLLAKSELESANIPPDYVSIYIQHLELSKSEDRLTLARAAAEKGVVVARKISYYNLPNEEDRYNIFLTCLKHEKHAELLEYIKDAELTREHRLLIAQKIIDFSCDLEFFSRLKKINLDPIENHHLLLYATENFPTFTFTHWSKIETLQLVTETEFLKAKNPFFQLEKRIKRLKECKTYRFPLIQKEFEGILQDLHELNKKHGIPFKLDRVTKKIAQQCDGKELIELTRLIRENYFDKSIFLLGEVCERAIDLYPQLKSYVQLTFYEYTDLYVPLLTKEGIHYIIEEKLRKKSIKQIFCPKPFDLSELEEQVQQFQNSSCTEAVFILEFEFSSLFHYSPLIFEKDKDTLKILISDSLSADEDEEDEEEEDCAIAILKSCEKLPFKNEIYFFSEQRQFDSFSCPIFTIKDIFAAISIYEKKEQRFIEFLKNNSTITLGILSQSNVHKISVPPPSMMKLTQSMSKISGLAQSVLYKRNKELTLNEYIEENSFYLEKENSGSKIFKKANLTAPRKSAAYFEKFLRLVVESQGETPTEANDQVRKR